MEKFSDHQLILCSSFANIKDKLLSNGDIKIGPYKVGFIKNAADLDTIDDQNPWWITDDMDAFSSLGCEIENIDLRLFDKDELETKLQDKDIIFVSGGNTYYLLNLCYKSGLIDIIRYLIKDGIIYISSSAGSIVAGPEISYIKNGEAELGDIPYPVPSEIGFGLTDFSIYPHMGSEHFLKAWKADTKHIHEKTKQSMILINDNQAVLVRNDILKII